MKNLSNYLGTEKGLTLIEILTSILILSILIMSFLTMFIQSSRTNSTSKKITDATYIAESSMEEINNAISTASTTAETSQDFLNKFNLLPSQYSKKCLDGTCYEKISNTKEYNVYVELTPKDTFISILVKVFDNNSSSKHLESQMEMLVTWKK